MRLKKTMVSPFFGTGFADYQGIETHLFPSLPDMSEGVQIKGDQ